MISSVSSGIRWTTVLFLSLCLCGLAVAATIIISLISAYLPNRGEGLARSTICQISFASMVSQAVGIGPVAMATADFNNDGILDLAVTNYFDSTTSVLLGKGNGDFDQQIKYSTGINAGPNIIAIGDLNNDNKVDMVVVNINTTNVVAFLGQGDGTFQQKATYSTGTNSTPYALALGDLNHDNILDLVVSGLGNNILLIFPGNGDGTFIQTRTLPTGNNSRPYPIVINYFNKDNHLDIAVGNARGNNVGIFFGDGTGYFGEQTTYTTGLAPSALIAIDFNRDSILDIATANSYGNSTSILLGNGDGTFREQKTFSTNDGSQPYGIRNGDFNRDNKQDLITANSGTNNIGILLGYGNGNFKTIKTYSTGSNSYPDDIVVGDFNGDDRLDFISANFNNNTIGIFLSTCS